MDFHLFKTLLRPFPSVAFAISMLLPSAVSAANEGGAASTGTLVGAVTCGADEVTPASNAVIFISALNMETRADSGGRFRLNDIPTGQPVRVDAANDLQQSSMNSRFNVVIEPGQTLDVGSIDIGVCPFPSTPPADTSEREMEQRANPND